MGKEVAPSGASASAADQIEREALDRIAPDPALLQRVATAARDLSTRAMESARRRGSPMVRCLVAGSAARGTFLADRLDIDFFMLFPPELDREGLEREGLGLARELLEAPETRYAEHPYLRGRFQGFAVDAVPGYAIEDPAHPISAVDRTPFHQQYLAARTTPDLVGQIRLIKQFLRAIGVYGSESRTGGFSGYLVELLAIRFGSFRALLAATTDWRMPVRLRTDPAARPRVPDDVALILDDPVDPHRNVASALSRRNLGTFLLAASEYLARPSARFFEVRAASVPAMAVSLERLARRGTHVSVLELARPELVDDILYPQLRKAERALAEAATRLGFSVLGTASAADASTLEILIEVDHAELPSVRVHRGPPADIDRRGEFLAKWSAPDAPVLQGPYLTEDGSLAVDTRRTVGGIEPLLSEELPRLPIGKDLRDGVRPDTHLRAITEVGERPALALALDELVGRRLPWSVPSPT